MVDTSLNYFSQVLSVLSALGVSEKDCLRAAGLSEFPKSSRVDADAIAHILNFAANNLNDQQIGINSALKYPLLQFTRPAEFLKLCANVNHGIKVYNRYCPLFYTVGTSSDIISENGIDRIIWTPNLGQDQMDDYLHFIEFIMTNYLTSINWLAWKIPNAVQQLNFKHEPRLPLGHYADLCDCDVKFGQKEYSIILKDGVKESPFPTADQAGLSETCLALDIALNALFEKESLIDRIELQIRISVEHVSTNKTEIAKALGLSERSMTRALMDQGTCYKDIKNRLLQGMAVAKINQGLPLAAIAQSLGYNDQSAFTRAYKKWFGCAPGKHDTSSLELN